MVFYPSRERNNYRHDDILITTSDCINICGDTSGPECVFLQERAPQTSTSPLVSVRGLEFIILKITNFFDDSQVSL